ncbi:MAG: 1-acyl-sn-glycerol-3-phosphate acyltransferase, partial [Candidatus Hydrogenedentes bacterium]|nr:1-acyl-sn-glycerol-3-phosphate acyltransferase [Candidatus Hydrogenedentota bacterium]
MALSLPCVSMIKDSVFWWPLGVLLRRLGGIPIKRCAPQGIVKQMVQVIRDSDRINVIVTPEGTRTNLEYWKLGFYRIAVGAGVPILFGSGTAKSNGSASPTSSTRPATSKRTGNTLPKCFKAPSASPLTVRG